MAETPSTWGFLARTAWSAAWSLGIAGSFLITWVAPTTFGETAVHKFMFVMLIEFLIVHSTGFFSAVSMSRESAWQRALMVTGLMGFYSLFALAFSAAFGGLWPFAAFLMLTLPRVPGLVLRPAQPGDEMLLGFNWSGMVVLFLGGVMMTSILDVPPLGISPEVIEAQGFETGGQWPEEPYRVIAFGAFYFTGLAILGVLIDTAYFLRDRKVART